MEADEPKTPQKQSKGYGKRPAWQWVVIYVVLAIIVYGLIYYVFIHKNNGGGGLNY